MQSILNFWIQRWALFFLLTSAAILGAALFFQFVLGYQPCQLCLYQRYPYLVVIGFAILAHLFRHREDIQSKRAARGFLVIILILLIFEVFLAAHHIGVEQGYWEAFTSCVGASFDPNASPEEIFNQMPERVVLCDERRTFLGISFAEYNIVLSALLSAFAIYTFRKTK